MSKVRVIKKYPNRRLYDTEISKYITMENLKNLVLEGTEFKVIDVKSEEDLTRSVLLQIIAEQEHGGEPIFSTESLTKIIRFYGDSMQGMAYDYLNQSLGLFAEQQEALQKQFESAVDGTPLESIADMTKKNIELWTQMQKSFFDTAAGFNTNKKTD